MPAIIASQSGSSAPAGTTSWASPSARADVEAKDGLQSFEILASDDAFDAILLVVRVPNLDGYETLERLKQSETLRYTLVIMI